MKYEIVEINRKTIIGFKSRIKDDETMPKKISDLWKNLYSERGIKNVRDRVNDNAVGIYYNYDNKNGFEYDCLTGCEVKSKINEIPENMEIHIYISIK